MFNGNTSSNHNHYLGNDYTRRSRLVTGAPRTSNAIPLDNCPWMTFGNDFVITSLANEVSRSAHDSGECANTGLIAACISLSASSEDISFASAMESASDSVRSSVAPPSAPPSLNATRKSFKHMSRTQMHSNTGHSIDNNCQQ